MFPIRAEDACFARQPLGVTSDAARPGRQLSVVPVPVITKNCAVEKAALEPATATEDANEDVLEVKCPLKWVDVPADQWPKGDNSHLDEQLGRLLEFSHAVLDMDNKGWVLVLLRIWVLVSIGKFLRRGFKSS